MALSYAWLNFVSLQKGHAYEKTFEAAEQLSDGLNEFPNLKNEVVIDDRTDLSIGRRVTSAKCNGYPYVIAAGKKVSFSLLGYDQLKYKSRYERTIQAYVFLILS